MTEITISKLDVALVQLETAIDLFLDEHNYICASTLAGAADEILGSHLEDKSDTAYAVLCKQLKEKYDLGLTETEIGKIYVNFHRNEFKHFHDKNMQNITVDTQSVAISLIIRSLTNLAVYDKSVTCNAQKFFSWLNTNRKDLLSSQDQH